MNKLIVIALASLIFLFSSCLIPSIHPLYTADVLVQKPEIEGTWINAEEQGQEWHFAEDGDHYYLTQGEGHIAFFETHLLQLENNLFLDLKPVDIDQTWDRTMFDYQFEGDKKEGELNELLISLLLPIHTFAKVDILEDEIQIRFFDPEWLEELFKKRKIRINHEKIEDMYLITASSKELQKFISKYADLEEAYAEYDNPLTLKRAKS